MANLTKANLQTSFDGHLWINTNRQKTGVETNIRLLDVAKHIIEKYDGMAEGDKLLPVPCYANCKNSIKAIAKKCSIEKMLRGTRLGTPTQLCNWLEELIFIQSAKCWDIQTYEQHRYMQRLLMKRKRKLQKQLNWIYLKQNNHYYTL